MAKQLEFDWNKRIIEKSLEYDDHNPKHRKELEEYLTRSNQALKTGKVEVKTPIKKPTATAKPTAGRSMNIDITLPPELTKYLGGK